MLRGAFVIFTCIKEPASGKCFNARYFKDNFGKPHFVLALCLYRLRKRKCGRPSEIICRNRVPVLAVHVLALNLQRKNQKGPHRKLSWEVRHAMRKWKWHRLSKLFTTVGVAGADTPLSSFGNINDVYHIRIEDEHLIMSDVADVPFIGTDSNEQKAYLFLRQTTYRCPKHQALAINHQGKQSNYMEANHLFRAVKSIKCEWTMGSSVRW